MCQTVRPWMGRDFLQSGAIFCLRIVAIMSYCYNYHHLHGSSSINVSSAVLQTAGPCVPCLTPSTTWAHGHPLHTHAPCVRLPRCHLRMSPCGFHFNMITSMKMEALSPNEVTLWDVHYGLKREHPPGVLALKTWLPPAGNTVWKGFGDISSGTWLTWGNPCSWSLLPLLYFPPTIRWAPSLPHGPTVRTYCQSSQGQNMGWCLWIVHQDKVLSSFKLFLMAVLLQLHKNDQHGPIVRPSVYGSVTERASRPSVTFSNPEGQFG